MININLGQIAIKKPQVLFNLRQFVIKFYITYMTASWTVQFLGIPLGPVVHDDILGCLTKVPELATPLTQLAIKRAATLVARHLM